MSNEKSKERKCDLCFDRKIIELEDEKGEAYSIPCPLCEIQSLSNNLAIKEFAEKVIEYIIENEFSIPATVRIIKATELINKIKQLSRGG